MNFYMIDTVEQMDLALIHETLSRTYWAKNIPFSVLEKGLNNSLCFGVMNAEHQQVGFARMITDRATFAYLADVFILPDYQGLGLSKRLMKAILAHKELQGLRRMVLATSDAHGLYEQFGFNQLANPNSFMEIWQPNVYEN
ncbi:GNAT family N-acetyltransferase [Marinomonas sp. 15G1-11]|uniref:GNAT family N-acetyltransferase n=1 Tax=Marinomonas phaeophyticola TaxID=3004091 RepID=A0ABT4JZ14_9GAMM|nr:GNAT family N-acetyltransferase [Marinomonas sp. 15G1-11]MCZ2723003.1 GNAT family N-acetyltransferase [Marinomonas sp. 15G1-11]